MMMHQKHQIPASSGPPLSETRLERHLAHAMLGAAIPLAVMESLLLPRTNSIHPQVCLFVPGSHPLVAFVDPRTISVVNSRGHVRMHKYFLFLSPLSLYLLSTCPDRSVSVLLTPPGLQCRNTYSRYVLPFRDKARCPLRTFGTYRVVHAGHPMALVSNEHSCEGHTPANELGTVCSKFRGQQIGKSSNCQSAVGSTNKQDRDPVSINRETHASFLFFLSYRISISPP